MFELRDPVHQTIGFDAFEKAVIDHPVFQRMRYVRQMGLSYLVYPGATHDRFSHMLGAMHVAGRVWDNIATVSGEVIEASYDAKERAYFRRILRLAALLHDVGHAPFSHVSEKLMPKFGELEIPRSWYAKWEPGRHAEHEDYSVMMIAALGRDRRLKMGEEMAQDVASLLHHGIRPSRGWARRFRGSRGRIHDFLSSLISGEIDVDRMDYLLRDSHHTGVAYGLYDMDHLIRNLGVTRRGGRLTLTIDSTAVRAFEDFLLARYHMFLQVYHHKTTNAFDWFLRQAFGAGEVRIAIPGTVKGYLDMRDSTYLEALFEAAKRPDGQWSRRFVRREPAKRLFAASGDDPSSRHTLRRLRSALTRRDVPFFSVNSYQYLSKLDATRRLRKAEVALLVREKRLGKVVYTPIQRYSALLKKYNEVIDVVSLYVLPEHYAAALRSIGKIGA